MTDTPKWYLAEPFMLGADMPDGWEGRWRADIAWMPAEKCRSEWPHTIFETRPVPERMVTLPPLPESVVRSIATDTGRGLISNACREAIEQLDGRS